MEEKSNPLDVKKIRDIIRHESARINLRSFSADGESAFTLSLALSAAVKKVFFEKSEMTFSSEPKMEKKLITQFVHRMRVDAMEKFNDSTVFSVIQLGINEESLEQNVYLVTLVVYLEQKFLPDFLRLLQYPYIDSEEEAEIKDGCGTLGNLIAGQYKKELANLGYKDLMMSHFDCYINTALDGVGIPHGATEKYEISFEVEGVKRLVVEMACLDRLPKWSSNDKPVIKKILVIDDDPVFVKTIEPFLHSHGYNVIISHNGEDGIKKLKEKPDLIILDIQMPVMDGYEFVLAKKKIEGTHQVPIIIMTVKEGMADMFKVEGAREYLLKPFNPEALLRSIQRCI